ncbi:SANT/Myb-like DNA-binding domain-containing protein [Bradyrhizobium sp. 26S5]|jgi:transcriptional regulator|uniref:SANT/Myb-like DNA-binding domain-containing protein n=1 Tax=Bradyrhizobium sp. 26S5 TaxID=3139729 RepID=UPI0030CF2A3E
MPAWSQEDEERLLQMVRDTGLTQREIAQKIGRTEAAVSARLTIIRKRAAQGME